MMLAAKAVLVTGAAAGIGRATALALAREGARLAIGDQNAAGLAETAEAAHRAGAEVAERVIDVTAAGDHLALVALAEERFGRLDAACNIAGITSPGGPVETIEEREWHRVLQVNLTGTFLALKAQIPALRRAGGGAIVNVASALGQVGTPEAAAYVASKHGVVGLTKAAALDCAAEGIRINAVGPGYTDTAMATPRARAAVAAGAQPIGRFGRPEEVAELIVWLASERATFATGAFYPIDGGLIAR
jgi:NAD(P)-dependent dehydrogenase (short-subunit alcohol dehydrogenase family)